MRIKRLLKGDVKALPLDGGDLLVFWQIPLEGELDLAELLELVPGDPGTIMAKLYRFAAMGIIELGAQGTALPPASSVNSFAPTTPPSLRSSWPADPHVAVTKRPSAPIPVDELFQLTDTDPLRITAQDIDATALARELSRDLPKITVTERSPAADEEWGEEATPAHGFRASS